MSRIVESIVSGLDTLVACMSTGLKQNVGDYCTLQTADSKTVLVSDDGSLCSIIEIRGVKCLVGQDEFDHVLQGFLRSIQSNMSRVGYSIQCFFEYDREGVGADIDNNYAQSRETVKGLNMQLDDLLEERLSYVAEYCAREKVYLVLWTKPTSLTSEQMKTAMKEKSKLLAEKQVVFRYTQNLIAAIPDLRNTHDSFVRSVSDDLNGLGVVNHAMPVHEAVAAIRMSVDEAFTAPGGVLSYLEIHTTRRSQNILMGILQDHVALFK